MLLKGEEFLFAHDLTGAIEPSPSGFQHLRVEQRSVLEEHVRASFAARSHERVVFDAHGLAEGALPQPVLRWTIWLEAEVAADGGGRRRARILTRLRRPAGRTHMQRRLVGALDTQEMNFP